MAANRKPNAGPYIVSWVDSYGAPCEIECHLWKYACDIMREKIIQGFSKVSVEFA